MATLCCDRERATGQPQTLTVAGIIISVYAFLLLIPPLEDLLKTKHSSRQWDLKLPVLMELTV